MHDGYSDIINVLSYSIGEYIDLLMNAIYSLFRILLLQTDSNGDVVGLNFLGTAIVCIVLLYVTIWLITTLIYSFTFGKTKEDLPKLSDTENESYWENQFTKYMRKDNYKKAEYAYNQRNLYRNRIAQQELENDLKAMRKWRRDSKDMQDLKLYRKYRNRLKK